MQTLFKIILSIVLVFLGGAFCMYVGAPIAWVLAGIIILAALGAFS